jgi:hypothetical protein
LIPPRHSAERPRICWLDCRFSHIHAEQNSPSRVNLDCLSINWKETIFYVRFSERGLASAIFSIILIAMDVRAAYQTRRLSPQVQEHSRPILRESSVSKHKLMGILSRDLINQSQYFAIFRSENQNIQSDFRRSSRFWKKNPPRQRKSCSAEQFWYLRSFSQSRSLSRLAGSINYPSLDKYM